MIVTSGEPAAVPSSAPQALVVVPFSSKREAELFAAQFAGSIPPLITEGTEEISQDPVTGERRSELCFTGGWRAKFAGGGEVVIARGDRRI